MQYKNAIRLAILGLIITLFAAGPTASRSDAERYPYLSARFSQLVAESYQDQNPADARSFYRWMDRAYKGMHYRFPGNQRLGLEGLLRSKSESWAGFTMLRKGRGAKLKCVPIFTKSSRNWFLGSASIGALSSPTWYDLGRGSASCNRF